MARWDEERIIDRETWKGAGHKASSASVPASHGMRRHRLPLPCGRPAGGDHRGPGRLLQSGFTTNDDIALNYPAAPRRNADSKARAGARLHGSRTISAIAMSEPRRGQRTARHPAPPSSATATTLPPTAPRPSSPRSLADLVIVFAKADRRGDSRGFAPLRRRDRHPGFTRGRNSTRSALRPGHRRTLLHRRPPPAHARLGAYSAKASPPDAGASPWNASASSLSAQFSAETATVLDRRLRKAAQRLQQAHRRLPGPSPSTRRTSPRPSRLPRLHRPLRPGPRHGTLTAVDAARDKL